jgi:hypothetical protein
MNKEEILKMSRKENDGKPDERELNALGKASRVAMAVGLFFCVALVLICRYVLDCPEMALAGWMIYFVMRASNDIVLFVNLKEKSKLIYGIISLLFAVAFAVAFVLKTKG